MALLTSISNSKAGASGAVTGKEGNAKPQAPTHSSKELRKSRMAQSVEGSKAWPPIVLLLRRASENPEAAGTHTEGR